MAKPTTLVETVPAFVGADPLQPVLADDLSRLTLISEDWCFDARNPDCYAGGVLPAVGAAIPASGLVSLAPGANPILNRILTVTAVPMNAAKLPTFDGKGIVFDGGTTRERMIIRKSGVGDTAISHPGAEGDVPFLTLISYKAGGLTTSNRGPYVSGQFGNLLFDGIYQNSEGVGLGSPVPTNNGVKLSAMWPDVWTHYAGLWFNLDRPNNQVDGRFWVNGELHASLTDGDGTRMFAAPAQNGAQIGGGAGTWAGTVARVRRIYMNPLWSAGMSDEQKVALAARIVSDDYNYCLDSGLFD